MDFTSIRGEIRPRDGFQLRNPNPDFMDFPKRICKTILMNSGLLFAIMRERRRPLFLRTVFQILFRIYRSNGKKGNSKTDISALKSVFRFRVQFQIRNQDFKILVQISQSIQRREWNENGKKNNRFNEQNSNFARAAHFFVISLPIFARPQKLPNFTFYRERKQATTKFYLSFWTWISPLEIQLQEGSPTFYKVSG